MFLQASRIQQTYHLLENNYRFDVVHIFLRNNKIFDEKKSPRDILLKVQMSFLLMEGHVTTFRAVRWQMLGMEELVLCICRAPYHIRTLQRWTPCWLVGSLHSVWWRQEKREEERKEERGKRKAERGKRKEERGKRKEEEEPEAEAEAEAEEREEKRREEKGRIGKNREEKRTDKRREREHTPHTHNTHNTQTHTTHHTHARQTSDHGLESVSARKKKGECLAMCTTDNRP